MGSTYISLHYHIVFSTQERRPYIADAWRDRLHAYLGGTVRGLEGVPESVGGVNGHVHLLVGLRATDALADFVREVSGPATSPHPGRRSVRGRHLRTASPLPPL